MSHLIAERFAIMLVGRKDSTLCEAFRNVSLEWCISGKLLMLVLAMLRFCSESSNPSNVYRLMSFEKKKKFINYQCIHKDNDNLF